MRGFLGENDMMAYLAMMAIRLIELHRVLKPTGSIYLHCDPTASHYLKLLLDAVFGPRISATKSFGSARTHMGSASGSGRSTTYPLLSQDPTDSPGPMVRLTTIPEEYIAKYFRSR